MSVTNEQRQATADRELTAQEGIRPGSPTFSQPDSRAGGSGRRVRVLGVLILLAAVVSGAGYAGWRALNGMSEKPSTSMLTHTVQRGNLLISITEDGNVESAANLDIKCQVAGGSSILWIIEDGAQVKKGDKLVQLDSSQLEDQINQQKITYEKARSAMVQAEKDYQVAQISVKEYLEGLFVKELQDADAQITIAMENLRSAQNTLEYSQRMFRKGYISSLDLESQQFAVQRAQLELDSANTAKEVLIHFTKEKTLEDLNSQVETAKAKMESEKAAFALEETRLKRLEDQLENCLIVAPQSGMVVYANEMGSRFRGSQSVTIEEGAVVRERQTIIRLPDLTKMQVKVNVHESKVEQLELDMRASIRILDRELKGTVASIATQPEPTSFFQASVKEYATIVRIDGEPEGLKPGMTAEVEILVADLKDVLTLPVAAVVEQRGQFYCWVKTPEKVERRPLVLGYSNDQFVEVKDGVREGEEVILNPRAVVADARAGDNEAAEAKPVDVKKKFGEAPSGAKTPAGSGPPAPGSGGGRDRPAGRRGGPGGPGGGGFNPQMIFNRRDENGDGKLTGDEISDRMAERLDEIDANGDGEITLEEFQNSLQSRFGGGGFRSRP